jgi:HD-GYP domain-containing protein (c-di-GMP phosphodiesterase class II)
MGLLREQIMVIASGAFLHDIGKIAVPDPIVLKQGVLAPDEAAVRQQHCWRGYAITSDLPYRKARTISEARKEMQVARHRPFSIVRG